MLTELCQELRNWFPVRDKYGNDISYSGTFVINNGSLTVPGLLNGQYYRITGSILNEGVHQYGYEAAGELKDETFDGLIWPMAIPAAVVTLASEIATWRTKYENALSSAMSPFQSESFSGYSYSKGSGSGSGASSSVSWRSAFASRLNAWRKL